MRECRLVWVAVLAAGWVAAAGCSRSPDAAGAGLEPTAAATDAEAQAAALELEAAVRSGDRSRAIQAFALEVLAHRVAVGLPVAADRQADVLKVLPARVDTIALVDMFVGPASGGGDFRLLGVQPADGRHRAMFRLALPNMEVMYLDVTLARFPAGGVGVEDVVHLNYGDRLTDIARRILLPIAALRDPGLEARLTPEDRALLAGATEIVAFEKAFMHQRWKEVVSLYAALPADLRDRLGCRVKRARALLKVGSRADQEAALAALRERFPDLPACDLLALDFHMQHSKYAAAGTDIAAVRAAVGADPMLDVMEAVVLAGAGQRKAATAAADRALAADPGLKAAYLGQIAVAMEAGDYPGVLAWMKRTVERTGHQFGDVRGRPAFAPFVRSPQYREWMAWQAGRG